jgi:fatty acid desaturase
MTPNRALLLAFLVFLAVEAGIFYALAALGANGRTVFGVVMVWLVVGVILTVLFVDHFEHEGSDDRGD